MFYLYDTIYMILSKYTGRELPIQVVLSGSTGFQPVQQAPAGCRCHHFLMILSGCVFNARCTKGDLTGGGGAMKTL